MRAATFDMTSGVGMTFEIAVPGTRGNAQVFARYTGLRDVSSARRDGDASARRCAGVDVDVDVAAAAAAAASRSAGLVAHGRSVRRCPRPRDRSFRCWPAQASTRRFRLRATPRFTDLSICLARDRIARECERVFAAQKSCKPTDDSFVFFFLRKRKKIT